MTIIAAAVGDDGTWIGSDGLTSNEEGFIVSRNYPKWTISKNRLFAFAGDGSIIPAAIMNRVVTETWEDEMLSGAEGVLQLGDFMREAFVEAKEFPIDHNTWTSFGYSPVVATPGQVDPVMRCLQVSGCGEQLAIGCCHELRRSGFTKAEDLVRCAIDVACHYSIHCGGEIFIERLDA
jgi:hypothetical protein